MTEATVWKWFSKFIRLRDSGVNIIAGLIGACSSCGKPLIVWNPDDGWNPQAHAGHFISRRFKATKYDEQNVHLQCTGCNTFGEGKQYEMSKFIDQKYGPGTAEKILIKSKQLCKRNRNDLIYLGNHYREKAKQLAKEKGIKL